MIKTILLDDDENSRLAAHMALQEFDDIQIVGEYGCSKDFYEELDKLEPDLLVLDIELQNELGFDIAKELRKRNSNLMIVFLTGHASYAIDGYDYRPINFLTKPVNQEKLRATIEEVRKCKDGLDGKKTPESQSTQIMFKTKKGYQFLEVQNILYIERRNRRNYVITETEEFRISDYTMKDLEEMLSPYNFILCHQSILLAVDKIAAVTEIGRQVYEAKIGAGEKSVPVARGHYEVVIEALKFNKKTII